PEGMHLTLKFIGEVEPDRAEQLWTALDELKFPEPFKATLDQPGVFPNP
ncbi:MAG: RNA 2',3'-cyclic phosphodiesterase, partial [Nitrospinaceae bacterium]|nr:RNA 2',3'-cyclic phosphodiesterase [Nitrospinaceae bacterium]NIT81067.1 RNA 2',3'-cyclic phosphodiesterase [Nitrospinaceae bacterium]NIW04944.1 RNA 2',3'-cyclic phosphodiesterase [Nitrospinaceae bacterium]NIX33476.1 RNA 2',3'-cyclic phosphodiesterase [Nitrospinaceae bacterium]NIY14122.1 RNA 2',3'-cyclic phosphodiesterase [Nitrospinaceae bacterium]